MKEWFHALDDAESATPIAFADVAAWQDRAYADSLPNLDHCPVGLSEAMAVSTTLPLSLMRRPEGWDLIANFANRTPFNSAGKWIYGYTPLALRLLPFHVDAAGRGFQIDAPKGVDCPEQSQKARSIVAQMMQSYGDERKRASEAIELIMRSGWIAQPDDAFVPLLPGENLKSFDDLSLTRADASAFQLFTIICFSQKNHRRKAPLFDVLRAPKILTTDTPETAGREFAKFLDFDPGISW